MCLFSGTENAVSFNSCLKTRWMVCVHITIHMTVQCSFCYTLENKNNQKIEKDWLRVREPLMIVCNQTHVTIHKRKNCHISRFCFYLFYWHSWRCTRKDRVFCICVCVCECKQLSNAYENGSRNELVMQCNEMLILSRNVMFSVLFTLHSLKMPLKCWKTPCSHLYR